MTERERDHHMLINLDAEAAARNDIDMWAIFGPRWVLPGSIFYRRRNAIAAAEAFFSIPWRKIRKMGYRVNRVTIRPGV